MNPHLLLKFAKERSVHLRHEHQYLVPTVGEFFADSSGQLKVCRKIVQLHNLAPERVHANLLLAEQRGSGAKRLAQLRNTLLIRVAQRFDVEPLCHRFR